MVPKYKYFMINEFLKIWTLNQYSITVYFTVLSPDKEIEMVTNLESTDYRGKTKHMSLIMSSMTKCIRILIPVLILILFTIKNYNYNCYY